MDDERKLMKDIKSYRNKLLCKVRCVIEGLFKDSPVSDQNQREQGYEDALTDAISKIEKLRI